jgi:hypothetical protein
MNTAEEKAKQLFDIFDKMDFHDLADHDESAKECATIVSDELINHLSPYKGMYDQDFFDADFKYWQEVKEHIKNMK